MSDQRTNLGSIYTPEEFAQFLCDWAIRSSEDLVLDLGVGEGVFTFLAFDKLVELGAAKQDAINQVYGSEIDETTYRRFAKHAKKKNLTFPNVHFADFFDTDIPANVDAVIGNPPYVRRPHMSDEKVEKMRKIVIKENPTLQIESFTRLTDLYVYFLLRGMKRLATGGRLAVIVADTWLNMHYGQTLKRYLLSEFVIEKLVSIDRRVFREAYVKPVLLFATKTSRDSHITYQIDFLRLRNGLPIDDVATLIETNTQHVDIDRTYVEKSNLDVDKPWGVYFKSPKLYSELSEHELMKPMDDVAATRIGVQTLAKEFFVFTSEQAQQLGIEQEFLTSLVHSSRYFKEPIISSKQEPEWYLFYCAEPKENLTGTKALEYILEGEDTEVPVRGKNTSVVGYHNKKRIQESGRKPWYNLRSQIEKRGRASILIPRLVYENYLVIWNAAQYATGELFIEFLPHSGLEDEVFLALLNSTHTEVMLRTHAQVDGGGTYNLGPGKIKQVPMLDPNEISESDRQKLKHAYGAFVEDPTKYRPEIDNVVSDILDLSHDLRLQLTTVLKDMHVIAKSTRI
ncbi:MAG: SAM-dependent methyltransferase [Chloroflexi bacterium]|nr:SAM-dependent methyltransferase [Chloroflexota bacterium]